MKRREFMQKTAVAGATIAFGQQSLHAQENQSLKGKKTLFVWGGWKGHEPKQCRDVFVPWLRQQGAELTVSDSLDAYTDKKLMDSLDLII